MTISSAVQSQFFYDQQHLIRLPPNAAAAKAGMAATRRKNGLPWTSDEHNRFLSALERYPSGPWKHIATFVGTRTTRQTMTHAQKYREKIARHSRARVTNKRLALTRSESTESTDRCSDISSDDVANIAVESSRHVHLPPIVVVDCGVPSWHDDSGHGSGCVDAAISLFLDEYEPFDLLSCTTSDDDAFDVGIFML